MKITDEEIRTLIADHAQQITVMVMDDDIAASTLRQTIARMDELAREIGKNPEPMK